MESLHRIIADVPLRLMGTTDLPNGEFMPAKHPKQNYGQQKRKAAKRRNIRKYKQLLKRKN